jgi:hypothetical protein
VASTFTSAWDQAAATLPLVRLSGMPKTSCTTSARGREEVRLERRVAIEDLQKTRGLRSSLQAVGHHQRHCLPLVVDAMVLQGHHGFAGQGDCYPAKFRGVLVREDADHAGTGRCCRQVESQ